MENLPIIFHCCSEEQPAAKGVYLVVVEEGMKVFWPESELDSFCMSPGGTYYSVAYWDGDTWENIQIDNVIYAQFEDEEWIRVIMWANREYNARL